jgi:hypothetical protein
LPEWARQRPNRCRARQDHLRDAAVLAAGDWSPELEFKGGLMAKVTGIGGVFFKSTNDHKKLAEWYSQNLGSARALRRRDPQMDRRQVRGPRPHVWHVAEKNTEWFSPSPSSFMINYHIDNMAEMLAELQRNGVEILRGPESDENGKFAWILDPDETKSNFGSRCRGMKNNKAK